MAETELETVHRMLAAELHRRHSALGWTPEQAAGVASELLDEGMVASQLGRDAELVANAADLRLWKRAPLLLDADRSLPRRDDDRAKAFRAEVRAIVAKARTAPRAASTQRDERPVRERLAELDAKSGQGTEAERVQRSLDRARLAEEEIRERNPGAHELGDE